MSVAKRLDAIAKQVKQQDPVVEDALRATARVRALLQTEEGCRLLGSLTQFLFEPYADPSYRPRDGSTMFDIVQPEYHGELRRLLDRAEELVAAADENGERR